MSAAPVPNQALQALRDGLRTPEELAANLTGKEIKALRDEWETEAAMLVGYLWVKYQDQMKARTKRRIVRQVIKTDPDPRIETKKMHAAQAIGRQGPRDARPRPPAAAAAE